LAGCEKLVNVSPGCIAHQRQGRDGFGFLADRIRHFAPPGTPARYMMKTLSQVGNWENYLSVDSADRGYAGPVRRMLGAGQDAFRGRTQMADLIH
jgi:hypothetical protein